MPDDLTVADTEPSIEGSSTYQIGQLLGRGGMGEVVVAHDAEIGRDVALKRMRGNAPDLTERFLREAKIQARLDHPAIVPVYELGRDREGQPFFTMKRLTGRTLHEVLGEEKLQRLLRAFVDVCHAIDFAHARGVVHRDLKPSNIMLGDYGEVYVLDWGVARVVAESEATSTPKAVAGPSDMTQAGDVLGTPGYMSPEQYAGEKIGPATDVWALGAILFEILTGQPLHRGAVERPSERTPKRTIAPELDEACIAALTEVPAARPTAKELGARVERYLDGDRDLERRRALAAEQVAFAVRAREEGRRREAIRAAGRALALDPDAVEAGELLAAMITEVPDTTPPEVEADLINVEREVQRARSRQSAFAYLAIWLLAPLTPVFHIAKWGMLALVFLAANAIAVMQIVNARTGRVPTWALMLANLALVVVFAQWVGAVMLTPLLVGALLVAFGSRPEIARRPALVYGFGVLAFGLPLLVELAGVMPHTFSYGAAGVTSWGNIVDSRTPTDFAIYLCGMLALLLITARFSVGITRARLEAQRHVHLQAWQLRQLLPRAKTAR
ncbi:MAG: serine/threonine protein kinase [Deltaproteobacteria bacterium]|nr:serine/threonine protein kinase [Deltaproteobacteria bacterium]